MLRPGRADLWSPSPTRAPAGRPFRTRRRAAPPARRRGWRGRPGRPTAQRSRSSRRTGSGSSGRRATAPSSPRWRSPRRGARLGPGRRQPGASRRRVEAAAGGGATSSAGGVTVGPLPSHAKLRITKAKLAKALRSGLRVTLRGREPGSPDDRREAAPVGPRARHRDWSARAAPRRSRPGSPARRSARCEGRGRLG